MVRDEVANYLEKTFLFNFDADITDSTDLFKAGIIDSHGYIQMMQFIQDAFHVEFSREELLSNVITSLSGIVASVEAKLTAARRHASRQRD
ncbi:MAG: acyl carrier protein [Steroidobacteraceae bacterium]